jgi:hypothetical protein
MPPNQKIFGLGLSRTGTTSLGKALNILGIPTIHFPSDQTTFAELRSAKYRLTILETYQAVVDIPLVPYYAQIDMIYPNSQFILTTRDMKSWLKSVENHWALWRQRDPHKQFTDFVCACVYGTLSFNADRFRYVFETHSQNIRRYFSQRNDLLVLNVFEGEGWDELCRFLGVSVPDVPFPFLNQFVDNREWMHKLDLAIKDICDLLPTGSTFILVDDGQLEPEIGRGRTAIPFLEQSGSHYGPAPDGITAIRELERLRHRGAIFIVFAWPSFWWLEFYSDFRHYLISNFRCAMTNDRIVAFDLRVLDAASG